MTETIDLGDVMLGDAPPENEAIVTYNVELLLATPNVLHRTHCTRTPDPNETEPVLELRETTGQELHRSLRKDHATVLCASCFGESYVFGRETLRCANLSDNSNWWLGGVTSLLLCYEAWKPGYADKWCQWTQGKTPEQIRAEAKRALEWNEQPGEPQVVYFGSHGRLVDGSWRAGVGDHVTVKKLSGMNGLIVHGLLPKRVAAGIGQTPAGIWVDVGPRFTRTHLELAVNLYETQGGAQDFKSALENRAQVVEAVRTAILALA